MASLVRIHLLTLVNLCPGARAGGLPESLSNLSSLEEMNVTGNQLQGETP